MSSKQEIMTKIEADLKASPEKRDAILSLWEKFEESDAENDNQPLPSSALAVEDTGMQAQDSGMPFVGQPSFYGYDNYVAQDNNTCGQAVIGSFVDFYNKNPFGLSRNVKGWDNKNHFDNLEFIGRIFKQFGPDYPWPNGVTVRETIRNACHHYGLKTNEWYPGSFSNGLDSRDRLVDWINKYKMPVAVLVDTGTNIFNNPQPYTLHWCTVYAYDAKGVYIATWAGSRYVEWPMFMKAWHCNWIPYPNNFYQLRVWA